MVENKNIEEEENKDKKANEPETSESPVPHVNPFYNSGQEEDFVDWFENDYQRFGV